MQSFHSGRQIPQIGFGTYQLKGQDCYDSIKFAIQQGYTHIDTASVYQNEKEIGNCLKDLKISRDKIFITSKLSPKEQGYNNAIEATNQILSRLQIDYVDLLLIHWPGVVKLKLDDEKIKDIRLETWKAMIDLQSQGKVKDIGVSNFQIYHLEHLLQNSNHKPVINQFEIHPLCIEQELISFCQNNQILVQSYSTLARNDPKLINNQVIINLAQKYDCTQAQLILKWALQRDFIIIPKSKTQLFISQNFDLQKISISDEDMKLINNLNEYYHTCWNSKTILV